MTSKGELVKPTKKSKSPKKSSRKPSSAMECVVDGCGFRAKADNNLGILLAHYNLSHSEWGFVRCVRTRDCSFTVPVPLAVHAPTLLRTHYKIMHGTVDDLTPGAKLPGARANEAKDGGASPSGEKGHGVSANVANVDRASPNRFTAKCAEEAATFAMEALVRDGTMKGSEGRNNEIENMERVACEIAEVAEL